MGTYKFSYNPSPAVGATVEVELITDEPGIQEPMYAFQQLLLGMTFHPDTIRKYLNVE